MIDLEGVHAYTSVCLDVVPNRNLAVTPWGFVPMSQFVGDDFLMGNVDDEL